MKKLLLTLTLLSFLSGKTQTFNYKWAKAITSTTAFGSSAECMALDASANVYVTGYFSDTRDFDPGSGVFNMTAVGLNDIFVLKLDSLGNFIWAKQMGGTNNESAVGITIDASNNAVITGSFTNVVDFDPGPGTFTLQSPFNGNYSAIFVCKLTGSGNFVWAKTFGGFGGGGWAVTTDAAGNVYSTGFFGNQNVDFDPGPAVFNLPGSVSGTDVYISKLDASGNFVFAKQFTGAVYELPGSIKVDASLNIFVSGKFQSTVDFDPGAGTFNLTSLGGYDAFVCKLDASGNFVWVNRMGGSVSEEVTRTALDAQGNVYVTGFFQSTNVDFDPGPGTFTLSSFSNSFDGFVWKLTSGGNLVWASQFANSWPGALIIPTGLSVNHTGEVFLAGRFNSSQADFDPGPGIHQLPTSTTEEIFICKLNASGGLAASASLLGSGSMDYCFDMTMDGAGNIYGTGRFTGVIDFDPGPGTATLTPGVPNGNAPFIFRLNMGCASPLTLTTGIQPSGPVCAGQTVTLTVSGASLYNWSTGATVSVITATPSGSTTYTVTGSANGCSGTSTISSIVNSCVGIQAEENASFFYVYPNPNHGTFVCRLTNDLKEGTFRIYNGTGQRMREFPRAGEKVEINLGDAPKGLYFICFEGGEVITRVKIMVE